MPDPRSGEAQPGVCITCQCMCGHDEPRRESPRDAVAAVVRWLRTLNGPQDPRMLADEIEATSVSSSGGDRG